jgi:hypothetical protein
MVRRNVVPQPTLVRGFILGRTLLAFVGGRLGQNVTEDLVNCIARPISLIRHSVSQL